MKLVFPFAPHRSRRLGLALGLLVSNTVIFTTGCDSETNSTDSSDAGSLGDASASNSSSNTATGGTSSISSDAGALEPDAALDGGDGDSSNSDASSGQADADTAPAQTSDAGDAAVEPGDASVESDASANGGVRVLSVQELTDKSATDYAQNEHGLIAGSRLAAWQSDWEGTRPAGIEGRLVVLQIVPSGVTTQVHVSADEDNGVLSYLVPAGELNVARNSGFSAFETDIPDGATTDAWLTKYAVDPRKDFLLLTFEEQESTTNAIVQSVGRAWVFFKYWGVAKEHLGILNGSVNWNGANQGVALSNAVEATFSVPPQNGTVSVRDLGVDATLTTISLEEIIAILKQEDGAPALENVRIVDARGGAEALGLNKATSTGRTDCASFTGTAPNAKCSTPFEGRIKGAHSVPWPQFLDTKENGFKFLPYDQLKTVFDEQANWDETAEWTIQYCRTNQRSTVTGIVASVILGYPTRLYETSFIEWGHAAITPGILPENSPYRTDLPALTEHAELHADDVAAYTPGGSLGSLTKPVTWVAGPNYNDPNDVSPASPDPWPANPSGWPKLDPNATTTRLAIDEDRAYLRGVSIDELD